MGIRDGICPRCQHDEIVQALPTELAPYNEQPLAASHEHSRWYNATVKQQYGIFNAFICRRCGYTEWYATEPEKIPIGDEYHTRLVSRRGQGPYR
jgi:predicted nucleic-acid-binding Zn-ribbon protein